jgi:magnesium chelatase family protein
MLVAAMNPCPCGYFGDLKRECRCGPLQVQRYRQRISGPLLDRIDLHIEVPAVEYRDIASTRAEEGSAAIASAAHESDSRHASVPTKRSTAMHGWVRARLSNTAN